MYYERVRFFVRVVEVQHMPKFITIGYGDRAGYDRSPPGVGTLLTPTTTS